MHKCFSKLSVKVIIKFEVIGSMCKPETLRDFTLWCSVLLRSIFHSVFNGFPFAEHVSLADFPLITLTSSHCKCCAKNCGFTERRRITTPISRAFHKKTKTKHDPKQKNKNNKETKKVKMVLLQTCYKKVPSDIVLFCPT